MSGNSEPGAAAHVAWLRGHDAVNSRLHGALKRAREQDVCRGTHFFEGRYENLYVDREVLPEVEPVLDFAREEAARILERPAPSLAVGFWFNLMEPGQRTLPHTHDDFDELLSAVYYVRVPAGSGNLLLGPEKRPVQPREGMFAFFPPDLIHEVEPNDSPHARLSLAMNFGPLDSDR
ncbi:MAG: hypothetical protein ACPGU7_07800 [Gammaproteobacteria bacterium]